VATLLGTVRVMLRQAAPGGARRAWSSCCVSRCSYVKEKLL
jgi:hypothetical protein